MRIGQRAADMPITIRKMKDGRETAASNFVGSPR
jgi:hypothetical protein